jgi:hypothetical protein
MIQALRCFIDSSPYSRPIEQIAMSFRVGIVGGGWYGCHIAACLLSLGFSVRLFERRHQLLQEASGNNQFRLHQGFHYARSKETRLQSRDGFQRFIERYPTLSIDVPENIYAVTERSSLLDFGTYKLIMAASGIEFIEMAEPHPLLKNVEGCLKVSERVIMLDRARRLFGALLGESACLGEEVKCISESEHSVSINGEIFDYAIDATWGHLRPLPIEVSFEPTLLLYYEAQVAHPAITLVDGPLASIYPTEDPKIFTLSSVPHTPLGRYNTPKEAKSKLRQINSSLVNDRKCLMEKQIVENLPAFNEVFAFAGVQLGIKTKPAGLADDRSCHVFREGRIFTVMSGKIDTIFFATERILSLIEGDFSASSSEVDASRIRNSIVKNYD